MNKELILLIERFPYTAQTTSGKLYMSYDEIEKNYYCFTLEDTIRCSNVKVYGNTGLPEGDYFIGLYDSPKFGKTLIIYTEEDKITIKKGLLKWVYALFHGGNDHTDTAGCVLVAKNRISNDTIQGSMKEELRIFIERKITEGYTVKLKIVNLPQLS